VMTEKTIVAACVLEKPILWARNPVQVIILASLGKEDDSDEEEFYRVMTQLIVDCPDLSQFVKYPSYDAFMHLLQDL